MGTKRKKNIFSAITFFKLFIRTIVLALLLTVFFLGWSYFNQVRTLQKIIDRLTAETQIAQVVVTDVGLDSLINKTQTTIKFLEYDALLRTTGDKILYI